MYLIQEREVGAILAAWGVPKKEKLFITAISVFILQEMFWHTYPSDRKESRLQSGFCIDLLHLGEMTAKGKISVSLLTLQV